MNNFLNLFFFIGELFFKQHLSNKERKDARRRERTQRTKIKTGGGDVGGGRPILETNNDVVNVVVATNLGCLNL